MHSLLLKLMKSLMQKLDTMQLRMEAIATVDAQVREDATAMWKRASPLSACGVPGAPRSCVDDCGALRHSSTLESSAMLDVVKGGIHPPMWVQDISGKASPGGTSEEVAIVATDRESTEALSGPSSSALSALVPSPSPVR